MGKKFDAIYETVVSRTEAGGGFLPGDYVKFRSGYKNTETYKHMPSTLQKEVDELATCGLNIKVCQVGDKLSGFSAGNQHKLACHVVLTIAADHGGGRTYGRVPVTLDMVDIVDTSGGLPVPDQFKKKDVVIIKPKQLKVDPNLITNVTDKGNGKNTPTNLKLAGESVKPWDSVKELAELYMESRYPFVSPESETGGWPGNPRGKTFEDKYPYTAMRELVYNMKGAPIQEVVDAISDKFDVRIVNLNPELQDIFMKLYNQVNEQH